MLIRFLASAVAISVATFLVPGVSLTAGSTQAKVIAMLCVAVIFGVVNAVVKPVFELVTAPLIVITLRLFLLVIVSIVSFVLHAFFGTKGSKRRSTGYWTGRRRSFWRS